MNHKIDFKFETPEENMGYLLWQTTMLWQRKMNRALDEVGLTHTQFVILIALAWLQKNTKNVTQKDIASHSNTDRMMVSKVLRKLQSNDLVDRKEHETDTRAKCVFLTKKGALVLQKAIEIKNKANDLFFDKIENKQDLSKILARLIE